MINIDTINLDEYKWLKNSDLYNSLDKSDTSEINIEICSVTEENINKYLDIINLWGVNIFSNQFYDIFLKTDPMDKLDELISITHSQKYKFLQELSNAENSSKCKIAIKYGELSCFKYLSNIIYTNINNVYTLYNNRTINHEVENNMIEYYLEYYSKLVNDNSVNDRDGYYCKRPLPEMIYYRLNHKQKSLFTMNTGNIFRLDTINPNNNIPAKVTDLDKILYNECIKNVDISDPSKCTALVKFDDIIKFETDYKLLYPYEINIISIAIEYGQLECLKYIFQINQDLNFPINLHPNEWICIAIKYNQILILKYLLEYFPNIDDYSLWAMYALIYDSLLCLKYIRESADFNVFYNSDNNNNSNNTYAPSESLKYAIKHGFKCSYSTILNIINKNDLDTFILYINPNQLDKCPLNLSNELIYYIIKLGKIEFIVELYKIGLVFTSYMCDLAFDNKHYDLIKFIISTGFIWNIDSHIFRVQKEMDELKIRENLINGIY